MTKPYCSECNQDREISALLALLASQEARAQRLEAVVREVMPDVMGGAPDLFWPDGGWEAWEERARAALAPPRPGRGHERS
jgi:hypothetical protein